MSTSIDGIQGVEIVVKVKKGEEFKHKLVIKDKIGASIPLPSSIDITLTKAGCADVVLNTAAGISILDDAITFDKVINFSKGEWEMDATVSGEGYPTFKIYGSFIVT